MPLSHLFSQGSLLSWRARLFLWLRETVWPWGAAQKTLPLPPQASRQTSTRITSCCAAAPLPTSRCTGCPKQTRDSTNVTSQIRENHWRAGWLLEVSLTSGDSQNNVYNSHLFIMVNYCILTHFGSTSSQTQHSTDVHEKHFKNAWFHLR